MICASLATYLADVDGAYVDCRFGLSYATFHFSTIQHATSIAPCESLEVSVAVSNTANVAASEVVQVYVQWSGASVPTPELQLVGFTKVLVPAGGKIVASVTLLPRHFAVLVGASTDSSLFLDCASTVDKEGCHDNVTHTATPPTWEVHPLSLTLYVGGQQPAVAGAAGTRAPSNVLRSTVKITGQATPLLHCTSGTPS